MLNILRDWLANLAWRRSRRRSRSTSRPASTRC
jgi:hypothetical protein